MIFRKLSLAMAVVASACTLQSVNADSIFEIADSTDQFSTLALALETAGLAELFSCTGDNCSPLYTVLAPDNDAFDAVDDVIPGLVDKLLMPLWKPQLQDVLKLHAIEGEILSGSIDNNDMVPSLNGEVLTFTTAPLVVTGPVNNATVVLDDGLFDVEADDGVIHEIDAVLVPSSVTDNLVDKLAADLDTFGILVALVIEADLVEALSGDGPFTVFAPTDQAFANLFEAFPGVDEYLLDPMNKGVLQDILKLHVSPANADSVILKESAEPFGGMIKIPTLTEEFIKVTVSDDGIMINDSNVVSPLDIIANNGIAHTLDAVLLPEGFMFPPESSSKSAKRGTSLPSAKSGKGGKRQQSMMGLQRMRQREHMTNTDQEVMTTGSRGRLNDRLSRVSTDEDEETLDESEQSMLF